MSEFHPPCSHFFRIQVLWTFWIMLTKVFWFNQLIKGYNRTNMLFCWGFSDNKFKQFDRVPQYYYFGDFKQISIFGFDPFIDGIPSKYSEMSKFRPKLQFRALLLVYHIKNRFNKSWGLKWAGLKEIKSLDISFPSWKSSPLLCIDNSPENQVQVEIRFSL